MNLILAQRESVKSKLPQLEWAKTKRSRERSYPGHMSDLNETPTDPLEDLKLAHHLADLADRATMERFHAVDLSVESKADMTLVSDADRKAEDVMRAVLSVQRPDDSVLGEERGVTGASERQWIIDPIDGTHNFVRGVPIWATLIGLAQGPEVAVGLVSAPALGRRWWAARGHGAFTGGLFEDVRQISVSKVSQISDAFFSFSSLDSWAKVDRYEEAIDLVRTCWRTRGFGDFWSYMMVAEGAVDIAAEPELEVYDMAALVPIILEAGGNFTSLAGEPGPWGSSAAATNGLLHQKVLDFLGC